ncbi:MAG: aminotransferase class V-fold PLP-dependent enzyme [Acidimicrobiales bacterium]
MAQLPASSRFRPAPVRAVDVVTCFDVQVLDVASEFDLAPDRVWLSASHQGPLPRRATEAVQQMLLWKQQPHHLQTAAAFSDLIQRLRKALATLVSAPEAEIVLANSASYGLHLLSNGLGLAEGDEVIVAANDFPSDILPWSRLEQSGVKVVRVQPAGLVLSADEVASAVTAQTRVVCLTWVHSFSGNVIDLDAIGEVCRRADALFVVNGSQGVGGLPISVHDHPVDALTSAGFKWLCGPYGTGLCWLGPRTLDRLSPTKLYWLSALTAEDLASADFDLAGLEPAATGRHDVFGTANFFNFAPFAASVELVLETGVERIQAHNQQLAARLIDGIDRSLFEVQDRGHPEHLSSIVFVRPTQRRPEDVWTHLDDAGIGVAQRVGLIRFAPHFYNSPADIDRALDVLNERF